MDVFGALDSIWHGITGGFNAVIDAAKHAARWVLHFVTAIFDLVGGAWNWMYNGLGWLGDNVIGFASRVLHLLEHVVLHIIPEAIGWLTGTLIRWAKAAIEYAKRKVEDALNKAKRFLLGLVNTLSHWAHAAVKFVEGVANKAWGWVTKAGKFLYDLVSHPDRLVAWILGALVVPLVKFFIERSGWLVLLLLRAFEREAVAFASMLEGVLARII